MNKKSVFKWNTCKPSVLRVFSWLGVILFFVCLAFPGQVYAQDQETGKRTCGTMAVHERLLKTYPEYRQNRMGIENYTRLHRRVGVEFKSVPVILPVVVHVVYNTNAQNISDAQINSQIDILNEDYRKLNADFSTVPGVFQPLGADAMIQFQLAVRDPDCNPTTGITRTSTDKASFSGDDSVKFTSQGGHDAWPRDKYLNIWVCNMSGGILGYAQFPGGPANTDGVVITYTAFGDMGTATAPFHLGRTATHEIGHWFNLFHIWGDDCPSSNECAGTDEVADTPNQQCQNYDCPSFPHISCGNGPNGDMFMNYMDYVDDSCMVMFTTGQSTRMDAALYGARAAILGSDGLIPPPPVANPDLWSQDKPDDIGNEPNMISSHMFRSEDIWVRKQNDGFANQEHENPEFRWPGFDPNYVYVRIRNRGCTDASSGTVKLYWAKASTALGWPAPWDGSIQNPLMGDSIGNQPTGVIAGGDFVILEFPWYPPNPADYVGIGSNKSHFCLLSRIETSATSPFGMTFPEGPILSTNVRNNNNIVWKNITVVDEEIDDLKIAWVTVGNILESASFIKFLFNIELEKKGDKSIFEFGTVTVHLGDKLFKKWQEGDGVGEGIETVGDSSIKVLKDGAHIRNIRLEPNELHTIKVQFKAFKEKNVEDQILKLNLIQYQAIDGKDTVMGGQQFVFKPTISREPTEEPQKPPLCWIIVIILVVIIIILLLVLIIRKPKK